MADAPPSEARITPFTLVPGSMVFDVSPCFWEAHRSPSAEIPL
jgi:hypothetical protein